MKILFSPCHYSYNESDVGSEPSWSFNIADRIGTKYPKSVVITGFKKLTNQKKYRIIELQKNKKKIELNYWNSIIFNLKYFFSTFRQLNDESFDLIHHVLPFGLDLTFNFIPVFNLNKNVPFIVGPIQSPLSFDEKSKQNFPLKYLFKITSYLSTKTLQKATKLIVINKFTKDLLLLKNIPAEKIEIISPGIDTKKFFYTPFNKKLSNKFKIITVGNLIKRKGINFIIMSMKEAIKKNKNIRLEIIGDGPEKGSLIKLVNKLKLYSYIKFRGHVSYRQIQKIYAKAHLFINMSLSESWGQIYLEAMSSGLPVLTTKNAGSNEIFKDDLLWCLVKQKDYKTMAKKIIHFVENPNLLRKLGKKIRQEAIVKYDWDKVVIPKYLRIYKQMIYEKTLS